MVKLSDLDLPVIFKHQLLFKAGDWNRWHITSEEVNKSVSNTKWDKINTSLIYSHKDNNPNEFAESWAGNVSNISAELGCTYGDLEIWDPDTAVKLKYGKAPMAISAGIRWSDKYEQPTNFDYRNFSLITDPGIRDKNMYVNFSANDKSPDGFIFANFENLIQKDFSEEVTSETSKGSETGESMNNKEKKEEHPKDCDCEECKKKRANFDSNQFELVNNGGNKEMLRSSITSELSAISLYEDMANKTTDKRLKEIFLNVAKEEKTHIGEFETLLKEFDNEQEKELENGEKEVEDKVGEFCNEKKEEDKEADMMIESIDDSHPTELMKEEVIEKKEWTMEKMDLEKGKKKSKNPHEEEKVNFNNTLLENGSNNNERGLQDKKTMTEDKVLSVGDKKANFEEETKEEEKKSEVSEEKSEKNVDEKKETFTNASPIMDDNFAESVASKLAGKIIPNLKPAPMTTQEFGNSFRDSTEDTIDRLAKQLVR